VRFHPSPRGAIARSSCRCRSLVGWLTSLPSFPVGPVRLPRRVSPTGWRLPPCLRSTFALWGVRRAVPIATRAVVPVVPLRRVVLPLAEAGGGLPRRVRGERSRSSGRVRSTTGGPRSSGHRHPCRLPGFPGAGLSASGVRGLASFLGVSCRGRSPWEHGASRVPRARDAAGFSRPSPGGGPFLSERHPHILFPLPCGLGYRSGFAGSRALLHRRVRNVPAPFPAPERPILPWALFPSKVLLRPPGRRESTANGHPLRVIAELPRFVLIPLPLRSSDLGGRSAPKRGAVFGVCPAGELRSELLLPRTRS
jgi:hypothetical protein